MNSIYLTNARSYFYSLPKTLIWNKIGFRLSNSLNLAKLLVNEFTKSISQKKLPIFLFLSDLSLLIVKFSEAYKLKNEITFQKSSSSFY